MQVSRRVSHVQSRLTKLRILERGTSAARTPTESSDSGSCFDQTIHQQASRGDQGNCDKKYRITVSWRACSWTTDRACATGIRGAHQSDISGRNAFAIVKYCT